MNDTAKTGGVLVVVVVVLVVFTLMTSALLQLGRFNELETIRQLRYAQAHWLAESGAQRAIGWILASRGYQKSLSKEGVSYGPEALSNGVYQVSVRSPSADNFEIQSTGTTTNGGINESVTLIVRFDVQLGLPTINQFPDNGTLLVNDSVVATDKVYSKLGIIDVEGAVNGIVHSSEGTVTGDGNYILGYIAEPEAPVIDTGYFDGLIDDAKTQGKVYKQSTGNKKDDETLPSTINLDPKETFYVDMEKSDEKAFSGVHIISGPGKLVVYGDLPLSSLSKIGDGVEIICSGDIILDNSIEIGNASVLFTQSDIDAGHTLSGGTVGLLALGSIQLGHKLGDGNVPSELYAFIYAAENVKLLHNVDLYGSIIGGWDVIIGKPGNSLGALTQISNDPDVLLPKAFHVDFGNNFIPKRGSITWQVDRENPGSPF